MNNKKKRLWANFALNVAAFLYIMVESYFVLHDFSHSNFWGRFRSHITAFLSFAFSYGLVRKYIDQKYPKENDNEQNEQSNDSSDTK